MNAPHQPGEIVADGYRIVETLGEGGNGITYKAESLKEAQPENHRFVALKALSLRHMGEWKPLELFEREARILQHLNHHRIPRYLDYFHVDTPENRAFYIVQELVEGQSLAAMVEKGWRTNEAGVRRIVIQVLEILVYLQDLKPPVIHRDIKPQNLIWGKDGKIFLVDFGAVRDTYKSTLARGSTVVGTFGYMAPEQFQGQAVPATDLYGLGATALFLLTHRSPAELPEERLKISFRSRVQISESFADWLERAIEPDAGDRFVSAREALGWLRGNVVVRKRRSTFPWQAGIGIAVIYIGMILNHFQYAILERMGFEPDLCDAASRGNKTLIRGYLDKGGDASLKIGGDFYLSDCAFDSGQLGIIKLLINRGLDLDFKNDEGATLLHLAIQEEQIKLAKVLINNGADVNLTHRKGYPPLLLAVMNRQLEIAKLLIKRGANVNEKFMTDGARLSIIHWSVAMASAIWTGDPELEIEKMDYLLLELIVKNGANVNITNSNGWTPLQLIWIRCYDEQVPQFGDLIMCTKILKLLLEHGANPNKNHQKHPRQSYQCYESLHCAIRLDNKEMVEVLIEHGADVNARTRDGTTPFDLAIGQNNSEIIKLLKSHGGKSPFE